MHKLALEIQTIQIMNEIIYYLRINVINQPCLSLIRRDSLTVELIWQYIQKASMTQV